MLNFAFGIVKIQTKLLCDYFLIVQLQKCEIL